MTVSDRGIFSHDQHFRIIRCPEGVYLYSSDTKTEYVFERLESGKYLQYQKDSRSPQYVTPNISEPLWEQIRAGNVSLDSVACDESMIKGLSSVFMNELNSYESVRSELVYEKTEKIDGQLCYKYTADIRHLSGRTVEQYWITVDSGICMKRIESHDSFLYSNDRTVEITVFETENCHLPEH